MMNIVELINHIPLLLNYFVPGYIFISCYRWSSFSKKENDNALVCKSIVVSYIFILFWKMVWKAKNFSNFQILIICLVSFIIGILLGNFSKTDKSRILLNKLKISRTLCDNIWVESIRGNDYLRIFMEDETSYIGLCERLEDTCREPIIILYHYRKLDTDGSVLKDYWDNPKEQIIINTKNVTKIELIKYDFVES